MDPVADDRHWPPGQEGEVIGTPRTTPERKALDVAVMHGCDSPSRHIGLPVGHCLSRARLRHLGESRWVVVVDGSIPVGFAAYQHADCTIRVVHEFLLDRTMADSEAARVTDQTTFCPRNGGLRRGRTLSHVSASLSRGDGAVRGAWLYVAGARALRHVVTAKTRLARLVRDSFQARTVVAGGSTVWRRSRVIAPFEVRTSRQTRHWLARNPVWCDSG